MRLLVTGREGQVASALRELGPSLGVEVVAVGRPSFDLERPQGFGALLDQYQPDVVVSAAAYTWVDKAEAEPERAEAVNAIAPGILAAACAERGLPILHLSTDYIFDGAKPTPYREDDPAAPATVYGITKRRGEQAVAAANPRHVLVRTAWVFGPKGHNFVKTMLALARQKPCIRVVSDQFGSPTYSEDLARALLEMARAVQGQPAEAACFGTFHLAGGGDTSWAGFANAIFAEAASLDLPHARITPISTQEFVCAARRPANSRLDGQRLHAVFGIALAHWHDGLARCLKRLAQET